MKKIINFVGKHKIFVLIVLIVAAAGGYFVYKKMNVQEGEVRYTTAAVQKGMLISSISGTGQVSALNQVDIKPKAAGDIVFLNVVNGQDVKTGELIAQIDSRDALRSISDARSSLETAQLELDELLAPLDEYTLIQAENALADANESLVKLKMDQENNYQTALENKQKAEDNLGKSYEDAYNGIADVFLDLPDMMTGLYDILYGYEISRSELTVSREPNTDALSKTFLFNDYPRQLEFQKLVDKAKDDYRELKDRYDPNLADYQQASRYEERSETEALIEETIETLKKLSDAIKKFAGMFDYWVEYRTERNLSVYNQVISYQSDLDGYTAAVSSHLSGLISTRQSMANYKLTIASADRDLTEMAHNNPIAIAQAERSIKEKEQKIVDLKAGPAELELRNKKLAIQQKQNALLEAQQTYADYFIRAPFDGKIAEIGAAKGDNVSASTVIATLITSQKIAEITLNEVDAAQVKAGQKATLRFDAVSDLSITGEVAEIDNLGAVSQGVVSYGVVISFDVQDERVKPGMSASASIIIESKPNVLLAPISAVKTSGQASYVEILANNQPQRKTVVAGISNDTMIEIVGGLSEGEEIITQTINNGASAASSSQSQNRGFEAGPSMGGFIRALR